MSRRHGVQIQTPDLMPSLGAVSLCLHVLYDRDLSPYFLRGDHTEGVFFSRFFHSYDFFYVPPNQKRVST